MSVYSDDALLRIEYPLLRSVETGAADPAAFAPRLRSVLFPTSLGGHKFSDISDAEADEVTSALAQHLVSKAQALRQIELETLRPRYDGSQSLLLNDASEALHSGLRVTGRAQREQYKDALVILQGLAGAPIGRRDFGIWFQVGWLLWQTEAPLNDVEEAFYQATRLSAAATEYHALAARHLAAIQILLDHTADAGDVLQSALQAAPKDPLLLRDAARAATLRGDTEVALGLVDRCLAAMPPLAALLPGDPLLEPQRAAILAALQSRREASRARAASATERWRQMLDLVRRAEAMGEITLPIPPSLVEGDVAASGDEDEETVAKAEMVFAAATEAMTHALAEARAAELRCRRHIEKLHQDKLMWEKSLAALRAEAEAMNLGLDHPPTAKGFLKKKNPEHERVFVNFHSVRSNLAQIDKELRDHLPQIKAALAESIRRREAVEHADTWLRTNGAALV